MIHVSPGPSRKRSRMALAVPRHNGFAVHLYRACAVDAGDQLISPVGVQAMLLPAYEGARGRTREQMAEVLRLPPNGAGDLGVLMAAMLRDGNVESCRLVLDSALRYEPGESGIRLALTGTAALRANRAGNHSYMADADLRGVSLSLAGPFTMILILPRDPEKLPHVERSLSEKRLEEWMHRLRPGDFGVRLSGFAMERTNDLVPLMASMGMQDPFDAGHADFSGLIAAQKAFVFSATYGAELTVAEAVPGPCSETIAADPPFLFLIRHDPTGVIVFMGRRTGPA